MPVKRMMNVGRTPTPEATRSTPNIGGTPKADAKRDAIHMAVAPVIAGVRLFPGQHVARFDNVFSGFTDDVHKYIGIVDPFRERHVEQGETFWLFLYPGTITSLRHEWTHPNFDVESSGMGKLNELVEAQKRVELLAKLIDQTYTSLMDAGDKMFHAGEHTYDNTEAYKIPGLDWQQFWEDYAIIKGVKTEAKYCPFTCSC